jgi:predicted Zn-dependent protease with MMP-like domain
VRFADLAKRLAGSIRAYEIQSGRWCIANFAPACDTGEAMDRTSFENLVEDAIRELPDEFRARLQNVALFVEDYPSRELLQRMRVPRGHTLFGLYEGVPLPRRGFFEAPLYPDQIFIFQGPIEDACGSNQQIKQQLKLTLVHEVAHFFGMDDDYLHSIGY